MLFLSLQLGSMGEQRMNMHTDTVCPEDLLVNLLLLFVKHAKERKYFSCPKSWHLKQNWNRLRADKYWYFYYFCYYWLSFKDLLSRTSVRWHSVVDPRVDSVPFFLERIKWHFLSRSLAAKVVLCSRIQGQRGNFFNFSRCCVVLQGLLPQ